MDKVDFKKSLDSYKAKHHQFKLVEMPDTQYLAFDGEGDPNVSLDFAQGLQALYPVAYKMKFASKTDLGRDYVVPPLEGLWWADDFGSFTNQRDKSQWRWTLLVMVPDWLGPDDFARAVDQAAAKVPERLAEVRFETLSEGTCVQTLHVGSFDDEAEILAELHDRFVPDNDLQMTGHHHEIYLSDRRRVAPERLRTILRQPVRPR